MSSWELDLSSSASAGKIRKPAFATVFRGYDPNQVLEYLSGVADHVEALESKMRQLESELEAARRQRAAVATQGTANQDPYEMVATRVADLVRTFDLDVAKLRGDAEAEVERMLIEGKASAEQLNLDAQRKANEIRAQAERSLQDARTESNKVMAGLASHKEALLGELRAMRDRMLDMAKDLETAIEGSVGNHVVMLEDARKVDSADAASITASKGQDSGA
jgi:cell division septum initiation protein DivIVA